ncbi:MAG: ABC transporter permease [Oscillospiraceae bacterium]|jgi:putative ABC transport system permease protein|nr:ABC transporter permease [Oscillospiraceae bacterium]
MTMSVYLSALSVTNLISRMPAAVAQGIIWGLMALGVFITFRLLDIPDMTVDGSFATGGAVTVMLLLAGMPAWAALLIAIVVGVLTGLCTGFLHTKLGIPAILAGILTQFALYSINLRIMTKANQTASVQKFGMFWENGNGFLVSSLHIPQAILVGLVLAAIIVALSYWYFGTEQGSALRATGNNPAMSRAQGIHIGTMKVIGLGISNGIVALAGGLMTQFQGTADVSMGRGAIVIGLAAIVIGEILCDAIFSKGCNFAVKLCFIIFGGIVYYAVMVVILWLKLDPNDLKLFTAIIVAAFLAIPQLKAQSKSSFSRSKKRTVSGRSDA